MSVGQWVINSFRFEDGYRISELCELVLWQPVGELSGKKIIGFLGGFKFIQRRFQLEEISDLENILPIGHPMGRQCACPLIFPAVQKLKSTMSWHQDHHDHHDLCGYHDHHDFSDEHDHSDNRHHHVHGDHRDVDGDDDPIRVQVEGCSPSGEHSVICNTNLLSRLHICFFLYLYSYVIEFCEGICIWNTRYFICIFIGPR